jgi:hypothetical protein
MFTKEVIATALITAVAVIGLQMVKEKFIDKK